MKLGIQSEVNNNYSILPLFIPFYTSLYFISDLFFFIIPMQHLLYFTRAILKGSIESKVLIICI